ncbi:P-loop containing nucleoside triphosphate hydrolase [Pseudocohnilembus persalinus]|uniref:p-loop containing nucleoside triphosphate hydrolase n=1 Tax=Pseudocohnilembus persalinus TaxID=266149 RepID=A0A0V0Q8T9_PSEPJ|nr:P-loop containing nucleoside triphosphate hydrolase [Pseudocohnilembus persalinus]|eukprot:KRW98587.1 P-loop containing nucleoside triphosphate hydrolase [Pseudocohnilembus persalinus]
MNSYNYLFKFIIIGDSNVGKSCILSQFTEGRFKNEHDPTIGVEFGSKNLKINEKDIKIQIWDTAGQESFRSITRSYYRGSIGAMLVYDISNRQSFEHLQDWLNDITQHANESIEIMVVGNKNDISDRRDVSLEEGEAFAKKYGFMFTEGSAKTGNNIEYSYSELAKKILRKIENNEIDLTNENNGIKVGNKKKINSSSMVSLGGQNEQYNQIDEERKKNCC